MTHFSTHMVLFCEKKQTTLREPTSPELIFAKTAISDTLQEKKLRISRIKSFTIIFAGNKFCKSVQNTTYSRNLLPAKII